jgi:hypothetical protein
MDSMTPGERENADMLVEPVLAVVGIFLRIGFSKRSIGILLHGVAMGFLAEGGVCKATVLEMVARNYGCPVCGRVEDHTHGRD